MPPVLNSRYLIMFAIKQACKVLRHCSAFLLLQPMRLHVRHLVMDGLLFVQVDRKLYFIDL
jgi:hypothetical protein